MVIKKGDFFFTYGIESTSDSHIGLETGTCYVNHGTTKHVSIFRSKG